MLNGFLKEQLDNLSHRMGGVFGMVDDSGHILYCASAEQDPSENLFKGYLGNPGELFDNVYFFLGDYVFYAVELQHEETVFLFSRLPEAERNETTKAEAARLLSVAAYALADQELRHDRRLTELFRRLFSENRRTVSRQEIAELCGPAVLKAARLRLVMVSLPDDVGDVERDAVLSVVSSIFTPEQGFQIIPPENSRICVICPLDDPASEELFTEFIGTLRDTITTEAMVDVCVSVSGTVSDVEELGPACQQAERARNIGQTFDLPQKYYDYGTLGLEKMIFSIPVQACADYVRETFGEEFLKDRAAQELLLTVRTFLDNNQNGSEAARVLYIHRNTMMYRLEKFNRLTGLDCSQFNTGLRIRLAMMILQYLEKKDVNLFRQK